MQRAMAVGEIGIVLSYESTRLSRNCSDWYPLLDLCTLHQCLIGDRERRTRFVPPRAGAVLRMLRNPAYAGAFVFGRTRSEPRTDPQRPGLQISRLPQEKWRVLLKDRFAGYIDWDTFQRIQDILAHNYAHHRRGSRGVPRNGTALLAGICYCGHCGHQMILAYSARGYYRCRCVQEDLGPKPQHESFRVEQVDPCVQESFFAALAPVELDLYEAAYHKTQEQYAQVRAAQERQLQRLRYEVSRARRQSDQSDPENRLVTLELERRWESALQALAQAEHRYELDEKQMQAEAQRRNPLELRTQFASIGQALPELWPKLPLGTRKAMLRCLVDKVVLKRLRPRERLLVRIVWRGGAYTDKELQVASSPLRSQCESGELTARVLELVEQGHSDKQIAQQLTAQGCRSPRKDYLCPATVGVLRRRQGKLRGTSRGGRIKVGGALTVGDLAQLLGVHRQWIYSLIYRGVIKLDRDDEYGMYLFPRDPEVLKQLRQLRAGLIHNIVLSKEHQDA